MRTTPVTLNGVDYLLCFSVRVSRDCSQRYGSVAGIASALNTQNEASVLDEAAWLFSSMASAGARYAKNSGLESYPAPSQDDILDNFDVVDFASIIAKLKEAISAGSAPTIELQPEGNAEATRE